MLEEFSKLQRNRVSERELTDAQNYLAGSFPLTIETPNDIATQVINNVMFELPVDEIGTFRERVLAITPDDIQRVARLYIKPDRLSIVLVGNAKAFIPQLRSVGFTEFEVIPIEQLDLMSATLTRESRRVSAEPAGSLGERVITPRAAYLDAQQNPGAGGRATEPAKPNAPNRPSSPNVPKANAPNANAPNANAPNDPNVPNDPNALLRRVVEARGGLPALKAVRTVTAEAQTLLQLQQGTLPST